ncbi:MAG: ABC transporter ATP-binding protein [Myxococcales bacterium]|nr:ABC transporter ATP-binding protein [Myxococcales bacterium]
MSELRARALTKSFAIGDRTLDVLQGIDLVVRPGETLGILGVSGSGKSTLLHILGGLERPSSGQLSYGDLDIYELEEAEAARFRSAHVGLVFQFHHLLPEFDACENVMMPCLLAGWPRARAHARGRELLEAVGLLERAQHRPGKLSGGERQRVAIARALAMSPEIVLADEPTGNLDPGTGRVIEDLLLQLNAELGTALILVTHNERLAGRLGKKLFLVEGRLTS